MMIGVEASTSQIVVKFYRAPYTFVKVPGFVTLWDARSKNEKGVYLWCIEHGDSFLVNYVGQTACRGGFESRLWQELKDWRRGLYRVPVDLVEFKGGRRVVVETEAAGHFERATRELEPLWRILLAPLPECYCCHVESVLLDTLRRHPATFSFLSNRDKMYPYQPKTEQPSIRFAPGNPPIIGLTADIPSTLTGQGVV